MAAMKNTFLRETVVAGLAGSVIPPPSGTVGAAVVMFEEAPWGLRQLMVALAIMVRGLALATPSCHYLGRADRLADFSHKSRPDRGRTAGGSAPRSSVRAAGTRRT